jgi:uncharacterized protein YifE (UPF0438 family)
MADARLRASRIRGLIAAENESWDRATEQRADAEYALEQFEESEDRQSLSEDEAEERREQLQAVVRKAREAEQAAERAWHEARERAEAKIKEEEAEGKQR